MAKTPDTAPVPDMGERLDHLVDTRGYSYDDARRELDVPIPDYTSPTPPAPAAELRPATDNPKNFGFGEWRDLSAEQKEINKAGAQAVRAALEAAKHKRGQQP